MEFRPYTNSNQYVSDVQQGNIPLVSPTEAPRFYPVSEPGDLLFRRPASFPMYRQRTVPTRKFGKAGRVGKSGKSQKSFDRAPVPVAEPVEGLVPRANYVPVEDGSYIVGVPRTDSLAEALGFYKIDDSDEVVFYDRDSAATSEPTIP